jgi:cell division transport system permease protein
MKEMVGIYMKISTWAYSVKQGMVNVKRNKLFSLASVATIAICIFLIGLFYSVVINFNYMVDSLESKLSITTFFEQGLTEDKIEDLKEKISKRVEVSKIEYTSSQKAWEDYKSKYFKDNPELAEGFKDDNPLADSASFTIYLNDSSMQKVFVKYLDGLEGIRQVNASENTATTLSDFGKLVGYVSVSLIAVLLAVGVFLISNTVMIGITVRKEEIGIMKLMGAADLFVRAPFMVEGILIGVAGAAIPLVILYYIYNHVVKYILSQFNSLSSVAVFLPTGEIFKVLTPMAFAVGAGIGLLGSIITMRRHLKV